MDDNTESINSTKTITYPYCYKIKENCLPCNNIIINNPIDCISELSNLSKNSGPYINKELKAEYTNNLIKCLKKYGDIYKELNIELYVNPNTRAIIFPDNTRIQSNFNVFLNEANFDVASPKDAE